MSIATQISRIQADKATIRTKLIELGLAQSNANLDTCATAIEGIVNKGAVNIEIKEGETYTIPAGYHNGSGVVAGVAGGGNYTLQAKTVTPTKQQQAITSDEGYYGLSGVTVEAIPVAYQDVSTVTAAAGDVLVGKIIVAADGTVITGTMTNNGKVDQILDVTTITFTIPKGYHDGTGVVNIVLEEKTATPTKSAQTITPTAGKVLSKVTINPIPDAYQDVTEVDAGEADVLVGKKIVDATGKVVTGTMTDNAAAGANLTPAVDSYDIPKGYHNGSGRVTVRSKDETVTPTKETQTLSSTVAFYETVTINPIPDAYQDVTAVTATGDKVLEGSDFVDAEGTLVEGSMKNNGAVALSMDGLTTTEVIVPKGYHDGTGKISLTSDIEEALAAI